MKNLLVKGIPLRVPWLSDCTVAFIRQQSLEGARSELRYHKCSAYTCGSGPNPLQQRPYTSTVSTLDFLVIHCRWLLREAGYPSRSTILSFQSMEKARQIRLSVTHRIRVDN